MIGGMKVLRGMPVLRIVTAADMPALEAETQVYPPIASFQTILTTIRAGRDPVYMVKMCTLYSQCMLLLEGLWG
jgi:hypothetical protein